MTSITDVPLLTLNNGVQIPQIALGVWQVPPDITQRVVEDGLAVGYRHIDTAQMYGNEGGVGAAVAASGLPRSEVFITSKINNNHHEPAKTRASFERSLELLQSDYVDLMLIHWPLQFDDYVDTWRVLEEFYAAGKARAIGTSNFHAHHLDKIAAESSVTPAANQVEISPYLTQDPLRAYDKAHGIATEAWSPLGSGTVLGDPVLGAIAAKYGVSPAQAAIRWHLQRGDIVLPKSTHRERQVENLDVFGFELSDEDVAALTALNQDKRTGPNPDEFNWVPEGD